MKHSYKHFFMMSGAHFVIMYLVMYTMIDSWSEFYNNLNQVYMALMMVTAMSLLMLWSMKSMYEKAMLKNLTIGSLVVFMLSFIGMRDQSLIQDKQFLKSMIPHHSGALLMCKEADISDDEIKKLCEAILTSQQSEIDQMKRILDRL